MGWCQPCPQFSTTRTDASASALDCVCDLSYYDDTNSSEAVHLPNCVLCSRGMECSTEGAALLSLVLLPGYWRPSNTTTDVRPCPDAELRNTSGCQGGSQAEGYCADGLTGPFCLLCASYPLTNQSRSELRYSRWPCYTVSARSPHHHPSISPIYAHTHPQSCLALHARYYQPASSDKMASCTSCEQTIFSWTFGLMVVLLAAILASAALLAIGLHRMPEQWQIRLEQSSILAKLKILFGFYAIVSKLDSVYEVPIPPELRAAV